MARLQETAFLPAAEPAARGSGRATRSCWTPALPGLADCLAPVLHGLITGPARHPAYAVLGVRRLRLAELADTLAALDREPAWWRRLYEALAAAEPEASSARCRCRWPTGGWCAARAGCCCPGPASSTPASWRCSACASCIPARRTRCWPGWARSRRRRAASSPTRPCAPPSRRPTTRTILGPVADAVLSLVAAAHLRPGDQPWLADLALPGADGEWYPAGELLLPGGPLAEVVAADTPFGTVSPAMLERHGAATLEAVGVLSSFGLLTARDVALDAPDLDLDGATEWAADTRARLPGGVPPVAPEVLAVRDLELVDPARWPRALELLAAPSLRAALVEPTRVLLADGRHADVPSYTAWWLRRHPVLGGHRPADVRAAGTDPLLAGLYDEAARPADPAVARALGVRTSLAELLAEPGGADELLDRLADPGRPVTRAQLRALWTALAAVAEAAPPDRVRAVCGDEMVVADAGDALVLDAPDLWPLVAAQPLVLAPLRPGGAARRPAGPAAGLGGDRRPGRVVTGAPPGPRDRRARCCPTLPRPTTRTTGSSWTASPCRGATPSARCTPPGPTASPAGWPGHRAGGRRGTCSPPCCATPARPPACSPRPTWTAIHRPGRSASSLRLLVLSQDALLGCRKGSVGKHALVVQLGELAQLRQPWRLVIRSRGRGLGRGGWLHGTGWPGGGGGSRAGGRHDLLACGVHPELTPEPLDLRHVPVLGEPPGAERSGRAGHRTHVTNLCAGDLKAPAADGTDQVVVRPVGHDGHEVEAHRLLRPDVVEEHLVMTVRAHALHDLAQIIRAACPEAENHHHAVIEARAPAQRFIPGR